MYKFDSVTVLQINGREANTLSFFVLGLFFFFLQVVLVSVGQLAIGAFLKVVHGAFSFTYTNTHENARMPACEMSTQQIVSS